MLLNMFLPASECEFDEMELSLSALVSSLRMKK